jgi:uncharacterized membrane protein (UPF0127 family)
MSASAANVREMRRLTFAASSGSRWLVDAPTTRRERRGGLRRRSPGPHGAMLFERCRSVHTFGMEVPITVVFLNRSWRVIRVVRASPGRIVVCLRARHVLECHIGAHMLLGDVLSVQAAPDGPATRGDRDSARLPRT